MKYERIPLAVDVLFMPDGKMKPRKLVYNGQVFDIKRVIKTKRYAPSVVPCIAPIEYTVQIDNTEKQIYFEPETYMWFSVKQINEN
jgi:hypothetical protein